MPFQPQALDERTLKKFVDRLLKSLRNEPTVSRATTQEHVARMLGFQHWHEAITAISARRSNGEPLPPALGLYEQEPVLFSPTDASIFLHWALARGASSVRVASGEPIFIEIGGKHIQATKREMTAEEEEAFSASTKNPFSTKEGKFKTPAEGNVMEWAASLTNENKEAVRIRVSRLIRPDQTSPTVLETSFRFIPQTMDLEKLVKDPEILSQLKKSTGLVLVGGSTGSGKSTLIKALLKEKIKEPNQRISSLEFPGEMDILQFQQAGPGTVLKQYDVGTQYKNYPKAIGSALRSDPSVISIGECRDAETIKAALGAADAGVAIYMGQHSENVPDAVIRSLRILPAAQWKDHAQKLISNLSIVITQRPVLSNSGALVFLQEWLVVTPPVASLLLAFCETPLQLQDLLEELLLEHHGQTYQAHARRLLDSGTISSDTYSEIARTQEGRRKK